MKEVLSQCDFTFGYLDVILIYSPDLETDLEHLELVFQCPLEGGLKFKEIKCNFWRNIFNIWTTSYLNLELSLYQKS